VQDSRLVVLNAMDAAARGADIRTRTRLVDAQSADDQWVATIEDETGPRQVRAKVLVNAAGPGSMPCCAHWAGRAMIAACG
jgi:glycerol-3-phosphate dehydrogenase